jgi:hypothetical protein
MRSLLATLFLSLSLAACSSGGGSTTTTSTSDPVVQPSPAPSTMHGSGEYTPAPEAYRRLCAEMPEACE